MTLKLIDDKLMMIQSALDRTTILAEFCQSQKYRSSLTLFRTEIIERFAAVQMPLRRGRY